MVDSSFDDRKPSHDRPFDVRMIILDHRTACSFSGHRPADYAALVAPHVVGESFVETIWWKVLRRVPPTCVVINHAWSFRHLTPENGMRNFFAEKDLL